MGSRSKGFGRDGMTKVRKPDGWRKIPDNRLNRAKRRSK